MTEEDFLKVEKLKLITSINANIDGIYNLGIGIHLMDFTIYKTDFDNDSPIIDAEILDTKMREKVNTLMIVDKIEHKIFDTRRNLKTIIKEFLDNRENYIRLVEEKSLVHSKNIEYYKSINYNKLEKLIKESNLEPENSINNYK